MPLIAVAGTRQVVALRPTPARSTQQTSTVSMATSSLKWNHLRAITKCMMCMDIQLAISH